MQHLLAHDLRKNTHQVPWEGKHRVGIAHGYSKFGRGVEMVTHFCPFDFSTLIAPLERNRHALLALITSVLTSGDISCYNDSVPTWQRKVAVLMTKLLTLPVLVI